MPRVSRRVMSAAIPRRSHTGYLAARRPPSSLNSSGWAVAYASASFSSPLGLPHELQGLGPVTTKVVGGLLQLRLGVHERALGSRGCTGTCLATSAAAAARAAAEAAAAGPASAWRYRHRARGLWSAQWWEARSCSCASSLEFGGRAAVASGWTHARPLYLRATPRVIDSPRPGRATSPRPTAGARGPDLPADGEHPDSGEGTLAFAAIAQDEHLRLIGERRDQSCVELRHGRRHDDETPGLRLHRVTIPESDIAVQPFEMPPAGVGYTKRRRDVPAIACAKALLKVE